MPFNILKAVLAYLKYTPVVRLFVHLFFIVTLCLVISFSYIIAFHFTNLLDVYTEVHSVQNFSNKLQGNMQVETKLEGSLQKLMLETQGNRAYVYRYHNGLAAVNGVPFFFQTMTHETIRPGTNRIIAVEQRLPASISPSINMQFLQNRCLVAMNLENVNHSLHYMYANYGVRTTIRCPIFLIKGDLFGFIGVDFTSATANSEAIRQHVLDASREVARTFGDMKIN
tara:strand:- start:10095 stop:10772 length:678 start_codon:yes stop_codon:yes gene_type:complete